MNKKQRSDDDDGVDQILQLPDHLVDRIISFLPLKDAVRTTILSKRWENLWITASPNLEFYRGIFKPLRMSYDDEIIAKRRVDLLNFMERTLRRLHSHSRTRDVCTNKLELYFPGVYPSEVTATLDRCIRYAIGCNVKELNLDINFYQRGLYNLSPSVLATKSLTKLSLTGCKLEFSSCVNMNFSSLKELSLFLVSVDHQILQNLIANCPVIEKLRLVSCYRPSNSFLKISGHVNPKLKMVLIEFCRFERIEIEVPGLECFLFGRCLITQTEINVSTCKNLRSLRLVGATITNEWLHDVLFKLCLLERLSLYGCDALESIKISSPCLKGLEVIMCRRLFNVEIDVPNLCWFTYHGEDVISFSSNALALLKTEISLNLTTVNTHWYVRWTEFLGKFNSSETLKLVCRSSKNVVVPKELRDSLIPPLYNVKHLSVSLASGLLGEEDEEILDGMLWFEEILDGMLWLSPHPESLSIASKFTEVLYLKFQYWKMDREDKGRCCSSLPITCFRHCLEGVGIDFGKEEDFGRNTTKFFNEHVKFFKKIYTLTDHNLVRAHENKFYLS